MNIKNVISYIPISYHDVSAQTPSLPPDEIGEDEKKALIKKLLWDHHWRLFVERATTPLESEEW